MTIGELIKEIRKEKGLTQKELAKKAHISEVSVVNYEKDKRRPQTDILIRILKALGVNGESLYTDYSNIIPYFDTIKDYFQFYNDYNNISEEKDKELYNLPAGIEQAFKEDFSRIQALTESFQANCIEYEIIKTTHFKDIPPSIKITLNNTSILLNIDDIKYIYNIAKSDFNNSIKNIIDILSTYKKQGD